ncbi:MAG TPA: hypothetical protein VND93_20560 [Myxococcales bacterium]|jgi:hypothetical protein|nr:hypothetical protein [Myxococcales bacterium]
MSSRFVVLASASAAAAALALACATTQKETTEEPEVRMTSNTVTNQTWFDLANCFGQAPAIPPRASDGVLVGLLQSANPQIMECLAHPKNRGPKERTVVTVTTKVPETGVPEHTVASDNITPDGESCIRGVLAKLVPTFTQKAADELKLPKGDKNKKMEVVDLSKTPPPAKGKGKGKGKGKEKEKEAGPITVGGGAEEPAIDPDDLHALKDLPPGTAAAQVKYVHDVKVQPAVRGDVNETSTAAGEIRLALPSMCACFEPWKASDPVSFQLTATLPRETTGPDGGTVEPPATEPPSEVTVNAPKDDATAAQVAGCVKDQVAKMTFKTPSARAAQVPYNFTFINSASGRPLGGGEGWAKYQQIEEITRQRAAEAAIAAGARTSAQTLYDQLVKKFQANNYSVAVKTLIAKCQDLLKADDAWSSMLQKQLEVEQQKKDVVADLVKEEKEKKDNDKNKDRWADAEKSAAKSVDSITADLAKSKDVRKRDQGACPVIKE